MCGWDKGDSDEIQDINYLFNYNNAIDQYNIDNFRINLIMNKLISRCRETKICIKNIL